MPTEPHLDVSEAVRVQILATEHWSLLATRSITYGAIYSRATIFLTVVSAAVVALALAAEATEFGDRFYVFALLVLPLRSSSGWMDITSAYLDGRNRRTSGSCPA